VKQSELQYGVYRPLDKSKPLIKRRLGPKPSHVNCGCPSSWTSIIEPSFDGEDVRFAVEAEVQNLNPAQRETITKEVKRMDGSGGLAPYEDFGIVNRRGNLALSIAVVSMQTGVVLLPNGGMQEPLFVMPDPMPPLRWYVDDLPTI